MCLNEILSRPRNSLFAPQVPPLYLLLLSTLLDQALPSAEICENIRMSNLGISRGNGVIYSGFDEKNFKSRNRDEGARQSLTDQPQLAYIFAGMAYIICGRSSSAFSLHLIDLFLFSDISPLQPYARVPWESIDSVVS
jgi:hypothetical protein